MNGMPSRCSWKTTRSLYLSAKSPSAAAAAPPVKAAMRPIELLDELLPSKRDAIDVFVAETSKRTNKKKKSYEIGAVRWPFQYQQIVKCLV